MTAPATADTTILAMLQKGDQFLAVDGEIDMDGDGDYSDEVNNGYYDLCYVQETETITDEYGNPKSILSSSLVISLLMKVLVSPIKM